jgi:hypothetical protein
MGIQYDLAGSIYSLLSETIDEYSTDPCFSRLYNLVIWTVNVHQFSPP